MHINANIIEVYLFYKSASPFLPYYARFIKYGNVFDNNIICVNNSLESNYNTFKPFLFYSLLGSEELNPEK